METRKLPNATISLVLGIISFVACCVTSGLGGLVLSGIALFLANKDKKTYLEDPEAYDNYKQVSTARTVAVVGLALAGLSIVMSIIFILQMGGIEGYMEWINDLKDQMEDAQGR